MKTFTEIKAMYPYQFEGKSIGLSIAKGWLPGFAKLCRDIDTRLGKNKRGFHWVQLKEKFGSARYYWAMNNVRIPVVIDINTPGGVIKYVNKPKVKGNDKIKDKTEDKELVDELNILISEASDRTLKSCIVTV